MLPRAARTGRPPNQRRGGRIEDDQARTIGTLCVCSCDDLRGAGSVSVVHGTVTKVDSATKTVVVKTADGTEHTIKVTADTTVKGTKEGIDGLAKGTEVVARTTGKGVDETGIEIGKVSKDGYKVTKGTVTKVDEGTKTVVIKSADGTEKLSSTPLTLEKMWAPPSAKAP